MSTGTRVKKAINAFIKTDPTASAIASLLTDKDCSRENILAVEETQYSTVALLPSLTRVC